MVETTMDIELRDRQKDTKTLQNYRLQKKQSRCTARVESI